MNAAVRSRSRRRHDRRREGASATSSVARPRQRTAASRSPERLARRRVTERAVSVTIEAQLDHARRRAIKRVDQPTTSRRLRAAPRSRCDTLARTSGRAAGSPRRTGCASPTRPVFARAASTGSRQCRAVPRLSRSHRDCSATGIDVRHGVTGTRLAVERGVAGPRSGSNCRRQSRPMPRRRSTRCANDAYHPDRLACAQGWHRSAVR